MSNKSRLLSFASLAAMLGKGFSASTEPAPEPKPAPEPGSAEATAAAEAAAAETAAAEAAAAEAAAAEEGDLAASVDTVLAADAVRLATEAQAAGIAAGTAQANARTKAVLESAEGKANLAAAAFLVCNSTASADGCIAHLATLKPAAEIPAADPPPVNLNGKAAALAAEAEAASGGADEKAESVKLWGGVQDAHNAMTAGGNGVNLAG